LTLARAENDFGDRSKAQALLRGRIAADPSDVEALQMLGWSCMQQARAEPASAARWLEEARNHLAAAFKLDPDNALVLYDYALTRRGEPAYPSENILNVLLKAQAIAPQVSAFRMGAVDGLVRRDRFEEAAVLLQPLLNNPHASREQVQAWRQQFDEIVARRKPAATSGGGDKDASDG
jgi:tetratricopeptide (TPR) repeat protein